MVKTSQLAKSEVQTLRLPKFHESPCHCSKCSQEDHWVQACPNPPHKQPWPCPRCNQEGHWGTDCPMPRGTWEHQVNTAIQPASLVWPWSLVTATAISSRELQGSHHSILEIHILPSGYWGHFFSPDEVLWTHLILLFLYCQNKETALPSLPNPIL